ncbi:hypothetical protein MS3_00000294 [Schistosoma haematobium]|uniref:Uncharacterized protein n=1 Tax=Schistosoma haematobium TaxID=6185 RepID=A0A922IRT0_SCHHA|nr:hypothetical protein MS3_00000294 [Schistosoma haematobium]KAH9585639.1 hypothetical protein MS3_00000294 [Schistosoma haematobium]
MSKEMTKSFSDNTKFSKPINEKNKAEMIEKQLIEVLKRIINDLLINKDIYERIEPAGSIIPQLYILPETHKPGLPLNQFLIFSDSLINLLEPIRKCICRHSVHDNFEFIEYIKEVNVNDKTILFPDVESLFINFPLKETSFI